LISGSYETAARMLDVPTGLVFMIATGRPADGGPAPVQPDPQVAAPSSPPLYHPARKQEVIDWVRWRAERELTRGG
jgi:hypothetical protein